MNEASLNIESSAEQFVTAFALLHSANLLTPENRTVIQSHPELSDLIKALRTLQDDGILTQESFESTVSHSDLKLVFFVSKLLHTEEILTQENLEIIFPDTGILGASSVAVLGFLYNAEIFNQKNLEAVKQYTEKTSLPYIVLSLSSLFESKLLTQEYFEWVLIHPDPEGLSKVLKPLQMAGIFNQTNLERVQSLSNVQVFADAIFKLYAVDILTQENFIALFQHKVLLMPGIWNRIPTQIITLEIFNELLQRAGQANPEEQISAYINNLLTPINDKQNTHTASVHYSVSESATRLANRYCNDLGSEAVSKLEVVLERLFMYLSDDSSAENKAAQRCIKRIIDPEYTFLDPRSGISLRQLFSLVMFAATDRNNQYGNEQGAIKQLIDGLYEIQRGIIYQKRVKMMEKKISPFVMPVPSTS